MGNLTTKTKKKKLNCRTRLLKFRVFVWLHEYILVITSNRKAQQDTTPSNFSQYGN